MKKTLLAIAFAAGFCGVSPGQTVIFDNGPLINLPGGGSGGADVSSIHDGMNLFGSGHAVSSGFRVADDIVIPAGETWTIDSLVFFAYQTNSTLTSTFSAVNVRIWDGDPSNGTSQVIFGDETTDRMITSEWSGIYRTADVTSTTCPPATCILRPIMRNATEIGTVLTAGTYWVDWQSDGSLASGPWCPLLDLGLGITTTGNALQFNPGTLAWTAVQDTVPANGGNPPYEPQGLPFLVVGSIATGLPDAPPSGVTVFPNPVVDHAVVQLYVPMSASESCSFLLYDILGNVVVQANGIKSKKYEFLRGSLPGGVYFYEVKKGQTLLKQGKLVLQ